MAACAAGPVVPGGGLGGAVWERSHARNFCGVTTWTVPRMVEWPMPHSSAHTIGKLPSLVGVMRYEVVIPGTASILIEKFGTQKSWITSAVRTLNCTGRSLG